MPLTVIRRKDTGSLTISGTVAGRLVRRRAASNSLALAREEAAAIEAKILRTAWHGERRGARSFDEAIVSYRETAPRSENTKYFLRRIRSALGNVTLAEIDQAAAIRLRSVMLSGANPSTYARQIITPLRAVLHHAADQGWCDPPRIKAPSSPLGRTRFMNPDEVDRLIASAAPHLRPLIVFLVGTGARMSEALELDWRDVDLSGGRAIFWRTKNGRRRDCILCPQVVASLGNLCERMGPVFRTETGRPYADHGRAYGGHIKTGWRSALRRAQLNPDLTPHDCRHTWASWHYAIHKDLLALKAEGGWASVTLVARYAHLMPAGHEMAIRQFWGIAEHREEGVAYAR